jgi:ATP-dependent RNA helicase DHX57
MASAMQIADADTVEEVLGRALDPPEKSAVAASLGLLNALGALDEDQTLTPLGWHLSALPVDVRVGKLLLFGAMFACVDSALTIAASL